MKPIITTILLTLTLGLPALSENPDSIEIRERINAINRILHQSERPVNTWWYGWLGLYSAATVGQGVVCFSTDNRALKEDMALGAATTALGAVFQLTTPITPGKDADFIANLPESNYEESLIKLQTAEKLLKTNAEKLKFGRSWQVHALTSAVNLGSGLITWLGFKRTVWDGVTNFLLNEAVSEIQIWTQPSRLSKEYSLYEQKYLKHDRGSHISPELQFGAFAGGVSMKVTF